jgi:predicted NUDIX family NTP pyrophosphohydrolase
VPSKKSAGILPFRYNKKKLEVMLAHPGGPFWKNKDLGAWSVVKGEYNDDEEPLTAAKREWQEETSLKISGNFIPLKPVRQKSGKEILAWAVETDMDPTHIKSNDFEMEWPPKSGRKQSFPEIDRAEWFSVEAAKEKINPKQAALIDELISIVSGGRAG